MLQSISCYSRGIQVCFNAYLAVRLGGHGAHEQTLHGARTVHATHSKFDASQNQGITQHTWHTVGPIKKRTTKIHGAKFDGSNA